MLIDTHCHLYKEYYNNIAEIVEKAKQNNVYKIIVNGCNMKTNQEILELINKYDILYGAIGFHPTELDDITDKDLDWLNNNINNPKIVAVGEIGLDYHYENINKELQRKLFVKQLKIAKQNNKPVIVHSRDSINETYNILKEEHSIGSIHCYSGSVEMALKFNKLGFYLGVGGIVTFKNAKTIKKVIKEIELEYILLETDAPYLTPEPYRGLKNDSSYLPLIAKKIAEERNVDIKEIEIATTKNCTRLFDF